MSDEFGDRMKGYEATADTVLPARLPVILRLDGNSFSRFTEVAAFAKPFDERFEAAMDAAAQAVLRYTGAVCAYAQSDEITLLLVNDRTHDDTPFLANRVQKLVSLSAATATAAFVGAVAVPVELLPVFDARVFVVPPSEVNNVFLWRQRDAFKNCVGSTLYYALRRSLSQREATRRMERLSTNERQEVLFTEFGVNVNDIPTARKRGRVYHRAEAVYPLREIMAADVFQRLLIAGKVTDGQTVVRRTVVMDNQVPLFDDGQYLSRLQDEFRARHE